MLSVQRPVDILPPPYTEVKRDDRLAYRWEITPDECARLSALLERDFKDTKLVASLVTTPPKACVGCGKYSEFIDWVNTALKRSVHSPNFIFNALVNRQTGQEAWHDVYCSGCGMLTHLRSRGNAEGGAPTLEEAIRSRINRATGSADGGEASTTPGWAFPNDRWLLYADDVTPKAAAGGPDHEENQSTYADPAAWFPIGDWLEYTDE
ncbi:hypothetical protein BC834DRAFT_973449 [Gloeopeniophorella convolvens]|nr:hypothetical protein BC834DRAFT_973449 [Gloeopeniophorella convolvens]